MMDRDLCIAWSGSSEVFGSLLFLLFLYILSLLYTYMYNTEQTKFDRVGVIFAAICLCCYHLFILQICELEGDIKSKKN
jgi:hypothetical protein